MLLPRQREQATGSLRLVWLIQLLEPHSSLEKLTFFTTQPITNGTKRSWSVGYPIMVSLSSLERSKGTLLSADFNVDIPYPSPADRKDLESLVKSNWNEKVQVPIGHSADQASDSYNSVKDWIFDRYV